MIPITINNEHPRINLREADNSPECASAKPTLPIRFVCESNTYLLCDSKIYFLGEFLFLPSKEYPGASSITVHINI